MILLILLLLIINKCTPTTRKIFLRAPCPRMKSIQRLEKPPLNLKNTPYYIMEQWGDASDSLLKSQNERIVIYNNNCKKKNDKQYKE